MDNQIPLCTDSCRGVTILNAWRSRWSQPDWSAEWRQAYLENCRDLAPDRPPAYSRGLEQ